jgi:hypothetical protein
LLFAAPSGERPAVVQHAGFAVNDLIIIVSRQLHLDFVPLEQCFVLGSHIVCFVFGGAQTIHQGVIAIGSPLDHQIITHFPAHGGI